MRASLTKNVSSAMPSVRVKICAPRMFRPAALNEPAILLNKPARSQVQILTSVVAAVGFVQPGDHGRERAVVLDNRAGA